MCKPGICSGFASVYAQQNPGNVEINNLHNKQNLLLKAPKPQRHGENSQMALKSPLLSQTLDINRIPASQPSGIVVGGGVLLLNRSIGILIDLFGLDNLMLLLVAVAILLLVAVAILLLVAVGILLLIPIGIVIHGRSQGRLLLLRQGLGLASSGLRGLLLDLGGAFDWAGLGAYAADRPAESSLDLAEADTGRGGVVVACLAGHGVPVDLWGC